MDTNIKISLFLLFLFTAIFIATLPFADDHMEGNQPNASEEMTPEEQIDEFRQSQRNTSDRSNFNRAVASNDESYCEDIYNNTLRENCYDNVDNDTGTESNEDEEENEYSKDDTSSFNKAIATSDETYCEEITNIELQTRCFERVS